VLVKAGSALEMLVKVRTLVIDKTGRVRHHGGGLRDVRPLVGAEVGPGDLIETREIAA
jgi:cation transport ATPase